jgi:hypothetical protein
MVPANLATEITKTGKRCFLRLEILKKTNKVMKFLVSLVIYKMVILSIKKMSQHKAGNIGNRIYNTLQMRFPRPSDLERFWKLIRNGNLIDGAWR